MSSPKTDDTKKLSITVGSILTFIVSLFLYRDLASFLVTSQLATGSSALWDALAIELILGAAAGLGAYFVVLKFLVEKGILQKLLGVTVDQVAKGASGADQADEGEQVNVAKGRLPLTTHKIMTVFSEPKGVVGVASAHDFLTREGKQMKDIMTPAISLSPKDDLFTAYTLMKSTGKTEIPVVEEQNGKKVLKSWITLTDVLAQLE